MTCRNAFLAILLAACFCLPAMAQKTVGTSGTEGYLSIAALNDTGWIRDDATYKDDGTAGKTIWNLGFMFYDGTTQYWADSTNFAAHTTRPTNGTVSNPDAQHMTNTGITFASTPNLSADLAVTLSSPTAASARITWAWTFKNSGASPINLRFVWFVDGDVLLQGTSETNDLVAFTNSSNNSYGAIIQGEPNGTGGVRTRSALLMDSTTAMSSIMGISYSGGPSFSDGDGAAASNGIPATWANMITNGTANQDANADDVADAGADSGAAMQWDLVVPASPGQVVLTHTLTFGGTTDVGPNSWSGPSAVQDWYLMD